MCAECEVTYRFLPVVWAGLHHLYLHLRAGVRYIRGYRHMRYGKSPMRMNAAFYWRCGCGAEHDERRWYDNAVDKALAFFDRWWPRVVITGLLLIALLYFSRAWWIYVFRFSP